jgi:hypothetical protein
MPVSSSRNSLLHACPYEIRHLIYKYIMPINQELNFLLIYDEDDHFTAEREDRFPTFNPSIFGVCRLTNEECTEMLWKHNFIILTIAPTTNESGSVPPPAPNKLPYRWLHKMRRNPDSVPLVVGMKLSYQWLRKMRRCHVMIGLHLDNKYTHDIVTATWEGALLARRLIHRTADVFKDSQLDRLHLYFANYTPERRSDGSGSQPSPQLDAVPEAVEENLENFLISPFQHALTVFGTLKEVQIELESSGIVNESYINWFNTFRETQCLVRSNSLGFEPSSIPTTWTAHQRFWLDFSLLTRTISSRQEPVPVLNLHQPWTFTVQLGPSQRPRLKDQQTLRPTRNFLFRLFQS